MDSQPVTPVSRQIPFGTAAARVFLWVAILLGSSGCQQLLVFHRLHRHKIPEASAEHPVVEIIALWEPGDGTGLDGLPSRGFVAQMMFFAHGYSEPVKIDGDVRIYVFDDQGTNEEQERPIHQFDFDSQSFQTFLTETNIGATYQFFIPYTKKGGHRATCSMRVRLTPKSGSPVYSKMASIMLPGMNSRKPDEPIGTTAGVANEGIQLVTHEAADKTPQDTGRPTAPTSVATRPAAVAESDDRERLKSALQASRTRVSEPAAGESRAAPATSTESSDRSRAEEVPTRAPAATADRAPLPSAASADEPVQQGMRLKPAGMHPLDDSSESRGTRGNGSRRGVHPLAEDEPAADHPTVRQEP